MHSPSSITGKNFAVFGAAPKTWGAKFARTIEPHAGKVFCVDPKLEAASDDPRRAIEESESIFFAVSPDEAINDIVRTHHAAFRPGQIILDCATTKRKIADTLQHLDQRGLSVCSTHPMARADLPSRGQNMLVMPVGQNGEVARTQAREIAQLLEMIPIEHIRFEQHLRVMSVVQNFDHSIQRAKIQALAAVLSDLHLSIEDIELIASANFRINELGTGRVGIQRPDVSANIIAEAASDPQAWQIIRDFLAVLSSFEKMNKEQLAAMFKIGVEGIDPDGSWRARMTPRTTNVIEQLANLDLKGMKIFAANDHPGLLEEIAGVFRKLGINLTAITSHVLQPEEGRIGVAFMIGIDKKSEFDRTQLAAELAKIGVSIE